MEIGEIFIQRRLAEPGQVEAARRDANGRRVDQILVDRGIVPEEDALRALADELHMQYQPLDDVEIDRAVLAKFPPTAVFRHAVLPLFQERGWVVAATSDPFDLEALDELSAVGNCRLRPVLSCRADILRAIKIHLGVGGDTINQLVAQRAADGVEVLDELDDDLGELAESAQAPSVIKLVNELLIEALEQRASDIHLEPQEHGLVVRYRIDGLLRVQPMPPEVNHFHSAIVTRLKIMSRLNIAEKRLPQDGRINIRVQGREIDVRVSIIPMLYGEGIVMRLLDKQRMQFNLVGVGMDDDTLRKFNYLITMPYGIILVTGPTGSGKTTTLYSALSEIKSDDTKIITVEDPVEYHLDGINQIQVHSKIGLTFAGALRSILRHDPDVVLIGEIRDGETATSAIQASLTGHLVFSTLHTNDAPGAFTRLVDMGVEPFLVASTVEGVLAQRLLRRLCTACKHPAVNETQELPPDFPKTDGPAVLWQSAGCRQCNETGFRGRSGIFELLVNDAEIRRLCVERASSGVIRDHALKNGMVTLRQYGYRKALTGDTTVDEVVRITRGDIA